VTEAHLAVPDGAERDAMALFCARVVRLDPGAAIRLRSGGGHVRAWAWTPFEVLATHDATGVVTPDDATVAGSDLLAALSVVGGPSVDAGTRCDERWRAPLPPDATWSTVGEVPVAAVDALVEEAIAAGEGRSPASLPDALLDRIALTVDPEPRGADVGEGRVPVRCLLALAGLGLLVTGEDDGVVRVSVGGSPGHDWLRLDVRGSAVVRRRRPTLVLRPV
jgi:hypothetical protein